MNLKTEKVKNDFSKRLHMAMDNAQLPLRGRARILSQTFGISDKGAGKWLKGEAIPETSKIPLIAHFLNVNAEWLLSGIGAMKSIDEKQSNTQSTDHLIPVLSWQQANQKDSLKNINADHKNWLAAHPNMTKDCYALEVLGESMLPEFRPHDYLYVTTDLESVPLQTGDFVIVQTQDHQEALFKRLVLETDGIFLQVLNEKWPQQTIPLTASFKIVARVVGFWRTISFV
jgi:phage repressor protein C with HTH and peptisase S24 domain